MQINERLGLNGIFHRRAGVIRRTRIQESAPKPETSLGRDKGIIRFRTGNSSCNFLHMGLNRQMASVEQSHPMPSAGLSYI